MARSWAVLAAEMIAQTCNSSVPIWPVKNVLVSPINGYNFQIDVISLTLRRLVKLVHIRINLLRVDGYGLLGPSRSQDHVIQPFSLAAEIALHVALQRALVHVLIVRLNSVDIGIRAGQEYFIKIFLFRAHAVESLTQGVAVLLKWSANDCLEAFSEIRTGLRVNIFHQIALMSLFESILDAFDLKRAHGCQNSNESILVRAKTFHGFAEDVCRARHVDVRLLARDVARAGWCWRS